ncbi:hypothetical protein PC129_g1154 [Phytophthora cactorum]|uniref:Uncharacterized protein n=1 Tax=Phytophthora cactorum TaxID=29920 RepID=A0A329RDY0_9STRA|nr:hypothetical protein PC112_g2570 [Phytophthora cactorum]KAG2844993.1 hypothetical protein PC111_g1718 [Phytophthora cactorum]KAG2866785.1 hypothetical protein PC113_g2535 [Phytophthora cactorum]KAG2929511.1 hypothetical protein PC114_g2743 [Phytophthora cactorum]KAG2941117.1 hypothetical protein PC115_g2167 [Phytophthora cactorum]
MDTKTVVPFMNVADMKGVCHKCGKAVKLVFDEQQLAEEVSGMIDSFVLTINVAHARFELIKMSPGIPSLDEQEQYIDAVIALSEVLNKVRFPAGDRGSAAYLTCRVTDMTSSIDDGENQLQYRIEELALDEPEEESDEVENIE